MTGNVAGACEIMTGVGLGVEYTRDNLAGLRGGGTGIGGSSCLVSS